MIPCKSHYINNYEQNLCNNQKDFTNGRRLFEPYACDPVQSRRENSPVSESPETPNLRAGTQKDFHLGYFRARTQNHKQTRRVCGAQEGGDYKELVENGGSFQLLAVCFQLSDPNSKAKSWKQKADSFCFLYFFLHSKLIPSLSHTIVPPHVRSESIESAVRRSITSLCGWP